MKQVWKKVLGATTCLALVAATLSVNSTCFLKIYQEKLPDELDQLRKFK